MDVHHFVELCMLISAVLSVFHMCFSSRDVIRSVVHCVAVGVVCDVIE